MCGLLLVAGCSFNASGNTVAQTGADTEAASTSGGTDGETSSPTTPTTTQTTQTTPTSETSLEGSSGPGCLGECTDSGTSTMAVDPSSTTDADPSTTSGETTNADPSTTSGETTNADPSTTSGSTTDVDPSTTGMMECVEDDEEPNDDPMNGEQVNLGQIQCKNPAKLLNGTLAETNSVDWFLYTGDDGMGSQCDGMANMLNSVTLTADAPVRVCAYAYCTNQMADEEINCQTGTKVPNYPGCCLAPATDGVLTFDLNCSGTMTDSAYVYVSFDMAAEACVDYSAEYRWDNTP